MKEEKKKKIYKKKDQKIKIKLDLLLNYRHCLVY